MFLEEGETGARLEVGGVDDDQRPAAALQVVEGGTVEQQGIVLRRRRGAAAFAGKPAQGIEDALEDIAGDISAQEARFEIAEGSVAVQAVISRGETATRHRTDRIHLVQQAAATGHPGIAQLQQHAIGKRCRARAAAGKRQHQGDVVRPRLGLHRLLAHAVARVHADHGQRAIVDPAVGGAGGQQQRAKRRQCASGPHRRQSSTRQNTAFR